MATTVQNIIDRAADRSNLNDAALIDTTELCAYITSYERRVFLTAARENPDFFGREGSTAARASGASWAITTTPGNVASITRVEIAAITGTVTGLAVGDEVSVVSVRNPDVAVGPRVYARNRTLYEYDSSLTTNGSNFVTTLKLFYSYLPSAKTSVSDNLDLPDEFDSLVVLPLARLMAVRDQREQEAAVIDQEFLFDWTTFLQQVSVFDEATIRELESVQASYRKINGQ